MKKRIHLFITVLFLASSGHAQIKPLLETDTTAYFDFWVGTWTAKYDQGDGIIKAYGTNTISKILDGQVVQESFELTSGKNKGFKGTSISVYQPRLKSWKQAWADNQGGYFDFTGDFEGDKRIFKTQKFEVGDQLVEQRMVFYDIKEDSFTWDWETSADGGKTWKQNWRIFYERVK